MTRRSAFLLTLGLAGEAVRTPAWAFAREFWEEKPPADWTKDEVERLLTKSPWTKDASITDTAQSGPLGSTRRSTTTRGRVTGGPIGRNGESQTPEARGKWKALIRWESALPIREALKSKMTVTLSENYVINVLGDIPNAVPSDDDSPEGRKLKFEILQEHTRLERKDDPIDLRRVELAPATPLSPAGMLFYFSRVLPLAQEDKQVTFVTKIGPLEVKCKFTLKEMMYRGNLEL